ncbi:MAG: chromosomal replication initiator protein DnaA [Phycisphaerae bacterium]|nr:chromosomal replication initiator protein DnaA [Phycisphaerae bacterium]
MNLERSWQEMLAFLRLNNSDLVRGWFSQLRISDFDRGHIAISPITPTQYVYLQNHCTEAFVQAAQSVTGRLMAVTFSPPASMPEDRYGFGAIEQLSLNEEYTFENFVTGPCNKLAHAASVAVAREPGKRYNPLFLYGNVGLGKSHLLQAVCHEVKGKQPDVNLLYISCETFINHFIEAVELGVVQEFRHRYRNVDILAIDDVQYLANKDSSQEEFFHTFNSLYQAQKQIILSSDRPPNEIETLTERLISRFSWGLVAGIDRPCYETRMAIIRKKARIKGVAIPEEVVSFLARSIESNTRELEGAITKLQGLAMLGDGRISMDMAQQVIPGRRNGAKELAIEQIVEAVTSHFNVKVTELQSKRRNKTLALPRQVCMFLARQLTRRSLEEIGGYFGGRDHSTVLHATKTIRKQIDDDPSLRATVEDITRALTGRANYLT